MQPTASSAAARRSRRRAAAVARSSTQVAPFGLQLGNYETLFALCARHHRHLRRRLCTAAGGRRDRHSRFLRTAGQRQRRPCACGNIALRSAYLRGAAARTHLWVRGDAERTRQAGADCRAQRPQLRRAARSDPVAWPPAQESGGGGRAGIDARLCRPRRTAIRGARLAGAPQGAGKRRPRCLVARQPHAVTEGARHSDARRDPERPALAAGSRDAAR